MNAKQLRVYCLSKPEAREDFPFGADVAVFRLEKKIFALLGVRQGMAQVNLKCDPDQAFILRDIFTAVLPGYHMNKKHWNTVLLDGSIPKGEIERMIDHSYALILTALPKLSRQHLQYEAKALYGVE